MTAAKNRRYRQVHASRPCENIPESPRYPSPPHPPPSSPTSPSPPPSYLSPTRHHVFHQQPRVCNPTKILPLANTWWNLTKPEYDAWVNQRRTPSDCSLPPAAGHAVSAANKQAVSLCNVATRAARNANQCMDMVVRQRTPRSSSTNITAPMESTPSGFGSWNGYTSWTSQTPSSQNPYQPPQYLLLPGAVPSGRMGNTLQRDLMSPHTVRTLLLPRRNIQPSNPSMTQPATQSSTCLHPTRCLTPILPADARSLPSSPSSESLIQYFPSWPSPWPPHKRSASSSALSSPGSGRSTPLRMSHSNIDFGNTGSRPATPMRSIAAFSGITPPCSPTKCMDDFTQCSHSSPSMKLLSQSPSATHTATSNATSQEDFSGRTMVKLSATCPELRPPYATHEELELGDPWDRNTSTSNRKILHARRNLTPCYFNTSQSASRTSTPVSKFTSIATSSPSIPPTPPDPESPLGSAVYPHGFGSSFQQGGMQQPSFNQPYYEQSGMEQSCTCPGMQGSFEQNATKERRLVPYKPSCKVPCDGPYSAPCLVQGNNPCRSPCPYSFNPWNNVPCNMSCFGGHPGKLTAEITCPNFKFRGGQYFKETDMHRLNGLQDLSDYASGPCLKPRRLCFAPSCPTLPTWSGVSCNCCCNMCSNNNLPTYEHRNGLDPEDQKPCSCSCHGAGGWENWLRESNGKPLVASSFPSWNNPCNGLRPCTSDSALAFLQSGSLGPPLNWENQENQRGPCGLNFPKERVPLCRQCANPNIWDPECYWNTIAHAHGMMPDLGGKSIGPSPCTDTSDYIHPERFLLGSKMIKDIDVMRNNGLQDDSKFLDPAFAPKKLEEIPSCPQLNPCGNVWPFTCGAPDVEPSDTESTHSKDSSIVPMPCPCGVCQLDWCPDFPGHPRQLQPPPFWRNWRSYDDEMKQRRRTSSQGANGSIKPTGMSQSRNRTTICQMIPFQNPCFPCMPDPAYNFPCEQIVPSFPTHDFCGQTDPIQNSPSQELGTSSSGQRISNQNIPCQVFPCQGIGQSFSCMGIPGQNLPNQARPSYGSPNHGIGQSFSCLGIPGQNFPIQARPSYGYPNHGIGQKLSGQDIPDQKFTGQARRSPGFPRQMIGQTIPCQGFSGQNFYGSRFPSQGTSRNFSRSSRRSHAKGLSRQTNVKEVPDQGVFVQGFPGQGFFGQGSPCQGFYDNNSPCQIFSGHSFPCQNFSGHSFPCQGQDNFNNVPSRMSSKKMPSAGRPLKGDQMPRSWNWGSHWPCAGVWNSCPQMNAPTWCPCGNPYYFGARTTSTAGSTLYSPRDLRGRRSRCLPSSTPQTPDTSTDTRTKGKSSDSPRFDITFTDTSTPIAVINFDTSSSPGASTSVGRSPNRSPQPFSRVRTSTRSTMFCSSIPCSCVPTQTSKSTPQSKARSGNKMGSKVSTKTYTTTSKTDLNARCRPPQGNSSTGTCTGSRSRQTQQRQINQRTSRRDSPTVVPRSGATTSASLCYLPSSSWTSTMQGPRNWNRPQLMHVTSSSRRTGTTSIPYSHDMSMDGALLIGPPANLASSDQSSPHSSASETCILRRTVRDGCPQGVWIGHATVPETKIRLRKPRSRFSITDYDSHK